MVKYQIKTCGIETGNVNISAYLHCTFTKTVWKKKKKQICAQRKQPRPYTSILGLGHRHWALKGRGLCKESLLLWPKLFWSSFCISFFHRFIPWPFLLLWEYFGRKWSCRQEPPLCVRNSNCARKALKCSSGHSLPLSIYFLTNPSDISFFYRFILGTLFLWSFNFCKREVANRNPPPWVCGFQNPFTLLHCSIVHNLAAAWPQFCLWNLCNH
jgi:hypothetical protein